MSYFFKASESNIIIKTKPAVRDRVAIYITLFLIIIVVYLNTKGFFDNWTGTSKFLWYTSIMNIGTVIEILLLIFLMIGFVHNGFHTMIKIYKINKKLIKSKKWRIYTLDSWEIPLNKITDVSIQKELPFRRMAMKDNTVIMKPFYSLTINIGNREKTILKVAYYNCYMLEKIADTIKQNLYIQNSG